MKTVSIESPAKINLHLEVGAQRPDGFHELRSLFAMVDLSDSLSAELLVGERGHCEIEGPFDFPPEENLISKAYFAFISAVDFPDGIRVSVDKRIPEQAGLGGGSSNAAAMLKLLCEFSPHGGSRKKAVEIAPLLGSDVPFFLHGPCALAEGRGEELRGIDVRRDLHDFTLLLVFPRLQISTAEAYKRLDIWFAMRREEEIRSSLSAEKVISLYREAKPEEWPFYNSFTQVLRDMYPVYTRLFEIVMEEQALYSEISGSGSALFALFNDEERADKAAERLVSLGIMARRVKMLASCPEAVYNTYS